MKYRSRSYRSRYKAPPAELSTVAIVGYLALFCLTLWCYLIISTKPEADALDSQRVESYNERVRDEKPLRP